MDDVIEQLRAKLPSHTFAAVERRANELGDEERATYLRTALENRERDEAWTAEQAAKG